MCGILGSINFPKNSFVSAQSLLKHRGPDADGEYISGNLFLYHTRLSIQDLCFGQQPFHLLKYTIIFNGEIYNHLELRERFNLICKTRSDTETILQLYSLLGKKALEYLDGMFAFAIYDNECKTLFLARDRAGEKPLYYYNDGVRFAFASEMNALGKCCGEKNIDHQSILSYLRYGISGTSTPYKNYYDLSPGSWLELDCENFKISLEKWWRIDDYYLNNSNWDLNDTLNNLDNLLHKSISNQLKSSDLEVATFLSGGIDSGLVTSIAAGYVKNLKTFTVSFDGIFDETPMAQLVAKKYSTDHQVLHINFEDLKTELPKIIANYGEPFADSSAIPSYYVSKEARKHVTVALTGDGADELFGGYRRYVPFKYYDFLNSSGVIKILARAFKSVLPFPPTKISYYNYLYRLMDLASKHPLESYLSSTTDVFEGYESKLIQGDNIVFYELLSEMDEVNKSELSGLKKIMLLDFKYQFKDTLLVKMDIAAMSNSLETRAPFLSKEIIQFSAGLPDKFKINGITTKYLLRRLSEKYLPEQLLNLPKRGFEVPLKRWVDFELHDLVTGYLSCPKISNEYVDRRFIQDLISNKISISTDKRAKILWYLLSLEIWYEKCHKT